MVRLLPAVVMAGLLHQLVKPLGVEARLLKRCAASPMRQYQFGRAAHIVGSDRCACVQRGNRPRRLVHHAVGAQTGDVKFAAQVTDQIEQGVVQHHVRQQTLGIGQPVLQRRLWLGPRRDIRSGIRFKGNPAPYHVGAQSFLARRRDFHHHAKTVQQLRP